jgi:hypothetical protein
MSQHIPPIIKSVKFSYSLPILMVLAYLLGGCNTRGTYPTKDNYSDSLVVAPFAHEVRFVKFHGTDQAAYSLQAEYPADDFINFIERQLESKGWQPLKEDYLNPGIPTSFVRGWGQFADATTRPESTVHQWMTDWENATGSIVRYTLTYRYHTGASPEMKTLHVSAVYMPAAIVKAMKQEVRHTP